jgi:biopolymer transport protein ExbD
MINLDTYLKELKGTNDKEVARCILISMIKNMTKQKMAPKLLLQAERARSYKNIVSIAYNVVLSSEGNSVITSDWK